MDNTLPLYDWDEESGMATCILTDRKTKKKFVGTATCAPEDRDMMTSKTGLQLAEMRANYEFMRWVRDYELKPAYKALKEYAGAVSYTEDFGKRSKGILYHRINKLEKDIEYANTTVKLFKKNINDFITEKDKFYQKIRKNRAEDKVD